MQSFSVFASALGAAARSFQRYVSCCGYDQNMMQGRAVSEKHVAGGSALPGEKDLTLIVADEGWLHSRHLDTKLRSSPEKIPGTWCDLLELIRQQGCPMFSEKKVCTESAIFSSKLLPQWHKDVLKIKLRLHDNLMLCAHANRYANYHLLSYHISVLVHHWDFRGGLNAWMGIDSFLGSHAGFIPPTQTGRGRIWTAA